MTKAKKPAKRAANTKPKKAPGDKTGPKRGQGIRMGRNAYGCTSGEWAFVLEYLKDQNGAQAAIRAGYAEAGAAVSACRMLDRKHVNEAVAKKLGELHKKLEVSAERTLNEIARVAYFDIRRLYDEHGNLKAPQDLDEDTAAALAAIDVTEEFEGYGKERKSVGFTKKVKVHSKTNALDMLAKHFGLFEKDNGQKSDAVTELLNAIANRGAGLPVKR